MEFLLFLTVVVVGVIVWGKTRAAQRASSEPEPQREGGRLVGGWLAFLILALIVLAPVVNAARIALDIRVAEHVNEALKDMDAWTSFKAAAWTNYIVVTALGVYAGLGLLLKRSWAVVRRAAIALWVTGPVGTFIYSYFLPKSYLGQPAAGFDKKVLVVVIVALIWSLYLYKSARVRATYQKPSQGESSPTEPVA